MRSLILLSILAAPVLLAQVSPRPADIVVPIVGSTRGQSNANFKTELQMKNATNTAMAGWLIYRPGTLARRYEIAPHATLSFPDVVAELGATGLGTLDVLVDRGGVPVLVVRAYDDQPAGTTGVTVPAVPAASFLVAGQSGALIAPRDRTRFRFNVGVRVLDHGAALHLVIRDASGAVRHQRLSSYDANEFEQVGGDAFAGIALQSDDSIEIAVTSGSAVIYATTVDNATNDSALQIVRR